MENPLITYVGIGYKAQCEQQGQTLLDVSIHHKIPHLRECGGHGKCTTCRVRILEGMQHLSKPTQLEKTTSFLRKWDPSIRLACQAIPHGNVSLQRLIWSSAEANKLQMETLPEGRAEEKQVAILFCDLRNFTKMSSQNLNFDIAFMLNRFYTALGEPILMNNGIIYQYVGDQIVGVFGTSGDDPQKICTDAVRAAIGMKYALDNLNTLELKDLDMHLQSGIGINFGSVFMGHLGHPTHRQFSVIGDPVNVASRIQDHTKETGTRILIADSVLENITKDSLETGKEFKTVLRGKEEEVLVHELISFRQMDLQLELQASVHLLMENEEAFAATFYEKVFEKAPEVRPLFQENMIDQGRLLTHMIGGIIYTLARPELLGMGLKSLGKNHVKYGVRIEHYPIVKEAMLETIYSCLEGKLSEERLENVMTSWDLGLEVIMDGMKNYKKAIPV